MNPTQPPPPVFFFDALTSYWRVLTIKAACELNLPGYCNDGPVTVEAMAAQASLDPAPLYRILRALAETGIFAEVAPRTFAHTPLSELLRADRPDSFRWMVLAEFAAERFPAWMNLPQSARTGEIAFDHAYGGQDVWAYYREHPRQGEYFARWMTGASHAMAQAILGVFDPSPYRRIIDVGGGQGMFLEALLHRAPEAEGVLFDLPMVIDALAPRPRIQTLAGNAFESVPAGGDLYILKWVIHDWDEGKALTILRNVRAAMAPGGKLALIEGLVSEEPGPDFVKWMDINMMVMTGGRERTATEYSHLLAAAGFRLEQVLRTQSPATVMLAGS